MDAAVAALAGEIRRAAQTGERLCIRAGGSKDFYGNPPRGRPLDPRGATGIVSYEPSELVITARGGTPLAEVEAALHEHGQMLAFEPPHFGVHATLGGCVASGLSGPRRAAAGSAFGGVRDYVLGATLLDGRGQVLKFGGTVMKNVAGYDVSRLLTGSLGTLGVLLEVSIKVLPRPAHEATLQWSMGATEALDRMRDWARMPLPVAATLWVGEVLSVRLAGAQAAVLEASRSLGGETLDIGAAQAFWSAVREQDHAFFSGSAPLWRLSLPAAAGSVDVDAPQLIEWSGAQRWLRTAEPASVVRELARSRGGHATLFRGGDKSAGVFTPLSPALQTIQHRLRAEFDPSGVFDGGRLYEGL